MVYSTPSWLLFTPSCSIETAPLGYTVNHAPPSYKYNMYVRCMCILHVNILTSLCRTSIAGRLCNRISLYVQCMGIFTCIIIHTQCTCLRHTSIYIQVCMYMYTTVHVYTVFPRIEAGVSISFVGFLTRHLNEAGLYSREASNSRTRRTPISIIRAVTPCSHSFRVHAILPRSSFYCSIICMAN